MMLAGLDLSLIKDWPLFDAICNFSKITGEEV
jgi:hypothetical protein